MNIGSTFRLVFGRVDTADRGRHRLITILQSVVTGLANRIVGAVVSLLSVPLTIGYLGTERYGIWVLIGSLLAWIRLADLGIGNGLMNLVTTALGLERPELARAHVSTALAMFSLIALVLGIAFVGALPWIDLDAIFGIKSELARTELRPAVAVAAALFLLSFPLSVIGPTYTATHNGKLANYWGAAGNLASLLALFAVVHTQGGLVWLVLAVSGTGFLVNLLSGIWLFTRRWPALKPRLRSFQRQSIGGLLNVGVQFFLIQILALIVFETDNLVIAHYLGADQVPTYSLTYTLFNYTSLIQAVLFRYLWASYTDAIARRDIAWVQRAFSYNLAFSLGSTLVAVVVLIFVAAPFIQWWAGSAVVPSSNLVLWMAGWSMINAFCSPIACLLAAASHMKFQVVYSSFSAAANVTLSIYLVRRWGVDGVIAGTVVAYLLFVCVPTSIDVFLLLRKLRHAVQDLQR